jgi:Tol biopolymer transport system component
MKRPFAILAALGVTALALAATAATSTTAPYSRIVSVGLDGSVPLDLTAGVGDGDAAAAQAPDGRIAFIRTVRLGFPELRLMGPQGGETRFLVRADSETFFGPAWSPNGDEIAIQSWDESLCTPGSTKCALSRVAVVDVATGTLRVASRTSGRGAGSFSWSPDGSRLVYSGGLDQGLAAHTLEIIRRDGTGRRVLSRFGRGDIRQVAWSPRGDWIAYTRQGWIWLQRPTGGPARRLVSGDTIRWAPRGGRLLYVADSSLRVVDPDTARSRLLARTGQRPEPAWSRDGQLVFYRIQRGATTTLYVVRVSDGSRLHAPTVAGSATSLFFTPDGKRLVYLSAPA